jgi:hypothetical protein
VLELWIPVGHLKANTRNGFSGQLTGTGLDPGLCAATQAWHTLSMTDPYSGFAFKVTSPDINSPGGVKTRQLLVVAKSLPEASKIADAMILGAMFENSGPEILARARELGIKDHDAGIDDGGAS